MRITAITVFFKEIDSLFCGSILSPVTVSPICHAYSCVC
nr:MAG TPA: hypothetical protein [Caudoviricetes sp.]